jgi:hypothetical protein
MDNFDLRKYLAEGRLLKEDKEWSETITLSDGETYEVYLNSYRLFTSDKIDRYSIFINNPNISEPDENKLLDLVSDKNPTLIVRSKKVKNQQTRLVIASNDENIHASA